MPIPRANLNEIMQSITEPWSPVEVARANDQIVRMALLKGEFHWHQHTHEDELFYAYKGRIVIKVRDQEDVVLDEGEMAVVPKGVEHCSQADQPAYVLLFEPMTTQTRGD